MFESTAFRDEDTTSKEQKQLIRRFRRTTLKWAPNRSVAERTGESVQLFVFREDAGVIAIEAFQNTRLGPVTDSHSAEVWRQFDQLWNNRAR
jgi:hypothetical protein